MRAACGAQKIDVCIIGSGGMATFLAVVLADSGLSIRCMHPARECGLSEMRLHGRGCSRSAIVAHQTPEMCAASVRPDLVIVACKWRDVPEALSLCQRLWRANLPPVLMPQNGIIQDEVELPAESAVFPLVAYVSVESLRPGVVWVNDVGSLLTSLRLLDRLVPGSERLLGDGVFRFLPKEELAAEQFAKLILASTGAVMALRDVTVGEALLSEVRCDMAAVVRESGAVVDARLGKRREAPLVLKQANAEGRNLRFHRQIFIRNSPT